MTDLKDEQKQPKVIVTLIFGPAHGLTFEMADNASDTFAWPHPAKPDYEPVDHNDDGPMRPAKPRTCRYRKAQQHE